VGHNPSKCHVVPHHPKSHMCNTVNGYQSSKILHTLVSLVKWGLALSQIVDMRQILKSPNYHLNESRCTQVLEPNHMP